MLKELVHIHWTHDNTRGIFKRFLLFLLAIKTNNLLPSSKGPPPKVLNPAPSSKHSVCIDRSILHSEERLWPELREELDIVYGRYDTARSSSNFGHHCLYIKKNDTVMKEDNSLKNVYADDATLFKSHLLTSSCLAKAKNLLPCPTELSCLWVKITDSICIL